MDNKQMDLAISNLRMFDVNEIRAIAAKLDCPLFKRSPSGKTRHSSKEELFADIKKIDLNSLPEDKLEELYLLIKKMPTYILLHNRSLFNKQEATNL